MHPVIQPSASDAKNPKKTYHALIFFAVFL